MNQKEININVQERLRSLESGLQVMVSLAVAGIETHPDPEKFRKQFAFHYETLHSRWLNSPLAEDWLDAADQLRRALDSAFDRPRP